MEKKNLGSVFDGRVERRSFLRGGLAAGMVMLVPTIVIATGCEPEPDSIYGPLNDGIDANQLRLPPDFTSRLIATSGQQVPTTGATMTWRTSPDGGGCFDAGDGGWIYVANSEISNGGGGASAIRFDAAGTVVSATSILSGTNRNCSGGSTPWGTWLSCEEVSRGTTYECDPFGVNPPVRLDSMGWFNHEAAAVDATDQVVYLTEDRPDGGLYRFTPTTWPDLTSGVLEVLVENGSALSWTPVPNPTPTKAETSVRRQVANTKVLNRGEGAWFQNGALYFTTTGNDRVNRLDPAGPTLSIVYDAATSDAACLTGVDNITGQETSGDLYVAEDGGNMQIVMIDALGNPAPIAQLVGISGSELTGVAFNPAGDRLYFNSQRNPGATYEITGPFRA